MPFGVVSGVGRKMVMLDRGGDCRRGSGSFGSKCGMSHSKQWRRQCTLKNYFQEDLFSSRNSRISYMADKQMTSG